MYLVAFGFIDSETQENWTWFMDNLRKAIGDPPLLAVSSDACKGLENVLKVVFPHIEQGDCLIHLMENCVKRYVGAENMYPAARAYRKVSMNITRHKLDATRGCQLARHLPLTVVV
jgi:transposase-like protein